MVTTPPPAAVFVHYTALTRWSNNPRNNADAVLPVVESIDANGWGAPIVAQASTDRIIAGDTRWQAAEFLATHIKGDDGEWRERTDDDGPWQLADAPKPGMVPVRRHECDDRTADRMALADNRTGENAAWAEGALTDIMNGWREDAEDDSWLYGTGFGIDEADAITGHWKDPFAGETGSGSPGVSKTGKARITVKVEQGVSEAAVKAIEAALAEAEIEFSVSVK